MVPRFAERPGQPPNIPSANGGETRAARYLSELEECCQMLAQNPALGRLCEDVRPGLRRLAHGSHVLFYRQEPRGILISRILHQRMLPERHVMDSEEADG